MSRPASTVPHSHSTDAPTHALPQECFTSLEWHHRDIDRVFKRRWLFVGHASQIPRAGDFFTYEIDKDSVLVVRGKDGEINSFHNVCRHRGTRLCTERKGTTKGFLCAYHNWAYGLDGRLLTARLMGPDFDKSQLNAIPVWVEEWHGMLFANLDVERPRSVADLLAKADLSAFQLARTKVIHDRTYTLASNWKLAAETYNECYHCAVVHPELGELIDPLKDLEAWDEATASDDYAIFSSDLTSAFRNKASRSFTSSGDVECKRPLGNGKDWLKEIAALAWFPQFGIFVYPDHAVTYSWLPITPTTCEFRSTWLVHQDAVDGVDYNLQKVVEFGDLLNSQDARVCEIAQLGIGSSAYRPGPYHPIFEAPLRGFNRIYLQQVR